MLALSHPALSLLHMLPQSVLAASQRAVTALHLLWSVAKVQAEQRIREIKAKSTLRQDAETISGHFVQQERRSWSVLCVVSVCFSVTCGFTCVWTCCARNGNYCYFCDPISSSGVVFNRPWRPRKGDGHRDTNSHLW